MKRERACNPEIDAGLILNRLSLWYFLLCCLHPSILYRHEKISFQMFIELALVHFSIVTQNTISFTTRLFPDIYCTIVRALSVVNSVGYMCITNNIMGWLLLRQVLPGNGRQPVMKLKVNLYKLCHNSEIRSLLLLLS